MNRTAMLPLCLLALWLTACGTAESAAPAAAPTAAPEPTPTETPAPPAEEIMTVSAMPTVIASACSNKSGMISFFRSSFENSCCFVILVSITFTFYYYRFPHQSYLFIS